MTTQFHIIVYHHRHGEDAWPVFTTSPPDLDVEAAKLEDWEPDREEWLESHGPFSCPNPARS